LHLAVAVLLFLGSAPAVAKEPTLDLEAAIAQSELIIAVRLADTTEAKIVYGGKSVQVTQQFRFTPVRTLKGVFARDALLLTGDDLGIDRFADASHRLEQGQMLLLFLGRRGPGYFNCNDAGVFDQSLPRLAGMDDPLLSATETLISVTQERDRSKKVAILLEGLRAAKGNEAVPLLAAVGRRALLAAQTPGVLEGVERPLSSASPTVREAAARTLAALLDADYLDQRDLRAQAVEALTKALGSAGPNIDARVALLDALGASGAAVRENPQALEWLKADSPSPTFAERSARLRAIGRAGLRQQSKAVTEALQALPLDAPDFAQAAAEEALIHLQSGEALQRLSDRIDRKLAAGLAVGTELSLLGDLPPAVVAPTLLGFQGKELNAQDQYSLAVACRKVAHPTLVPLLARMLNPRQQNTRAMALDALRAIDTDDAAKAVWPHLGEDANLYNKLIISEFLGRHGYRDGYAYAIEHMSEPQLRDTAVEALAAIREPKAIAELRKIWDTSHDVSWNAAAIRALGRLGQSDLAARMLAVAQDLRSPLAPPALIALGDLGEPKALPLVREGLSSRSDEVVIASTRAARKLLANANAQANDVRERIAALLADPDASQPVRTEALDTLVSLDDPRLGPALSTAVRDAGLENTPLLQRVEERLTARRERVAQR